MALTVRYGQVPAARVTNGVTMHRPRCDQAGLQLLKERQDVTTLQLTADDHFAIVINAVDLKYRRQSRDRRQLKRCYVLAFFEKLQPCLVGIEACASSHHWSRELQALGHTVRLMPPAYVKPYVKRQKNDAADAEAICEAVTRTNMRFVPIKTPEQQSGLMLHRTRHLFRPR